MRKIKLITLYIAIFCFLAAPAAASSLTDAIVKERDFLALFSGYDEYFLNDIERLDDKRVGLILMDSYGIELSLVFDRKSMKQIYLDCRIPGKSAKDKMLNDSIPMKDVKKLSEAAIKHHKELKEIWQLKEGKAGNMYPQKPQ